VAFVEKALRNASVESLGAKPNQMTALTGARAIAALWVVAFHYAPQGVSGWTQIGTRMLTRSGIAVSFFYVLSGFILTYTYGAATRKDTIQRFWWARFARIYPAYAVAFVLISPFILCEGPKNGMVEKTVWSGLTSIALLQSWFPMLALQWNPPAWSLSVEAFFYVLFPFLLPRLKAVRRIPYLFIILPAVSLAGLGLWAFVVASVTQHRIQWQHVLCTFPLFRLPEFLTGCITGIFYLRKNRLPRFAGPALILALFLILVSPVKPWMLFFIQNGGLAPLLAGLVLALACGEKSKVNTVLSGRWIVLLGNASYSIYILQTPIWFWFHATAARLFGPSNINTMAFFIAYLGCLISISILSFYFIEEPLRNWTVSHRSLTPTGVGVPHATPLRQIAVPSLNLLDPYI
jgi:peptidoglycan/LPS O-acetylase OafA/YrhL